MQYGFYFNADVCTGCRTCAMACKDKNNVELGIKLRKVCDYSGGTWEERDGVCYPSNVFTYSVSIACNHCENPACVAVCPTGAMQKDPETGIVTSAHDVCIACGACRQACPYDAPRISQSLGYTIKCDMCADLVEEGLRPACVDACLMRALDFGDIEDLRAKYGDNADIAPLASSESTKPSLVIGLSRHCALNEPGVVTSAAEELE